MSKVEDNATASSRVALQLLHGYGAANNSGNRWFDKTLQVNYFVYSYRVLNMKNNSPVNICSLLLVKMGSMGFVMSMLQLKDLQLLILLTS